MVLNGFHQYLSQTTRFLNSLHTFKAQTTPLSYQKPTNKTMKTFITTTTFTCLLLLIGFQATFSQAQTSSNIMSANVYSLPFSNGTSMTASTTFGSPSNPYTRQLTLKPMQAAAVPVPVSASQPGTMMGEMTITLCDSYPPPCPYGEGMIVIDMGMEYLAMSGLDPASLSANGLQAGDRFEAGQYLGTLSTGHSLQLEVYVPDVPGQPFDASGQLIRNWVTVTKGRETYTYDTHNRIPVICNGSNVGPLYNGQFLTSAGCSSLKTNAPDVNAASLVLYPQPASHTLTFELKGVETQNSTIELIDTQGRNIGTYTAKGNYTEIDVSNLKSGLYFYRFASESILKSGKVLIVN